MSLDGDYIVIAYDTTSSSGSQVVVLDISSPSSPVNVGEYSVSSAVQPSNTVRYTTGVAVNGSYAYVAYGSFFMDIDYIDIIDLTNPSNPVLLHTIEDDKYASSGLSFYYGTKALNNIKEITVSNNSLYVFSEEGLSILDVSAISTSFSNWQNWYFSGAEISSGDADGNLDVDGDGYSNAYEFLFGMNPRDGSGSGAPNVGNVTNNSLKYLGITFNRRTDTSVPITYTIEYSSDLINWTSGVIGVDLEHLPSSPSNNGNGTETVSLRYYQDQSMAPNLFFRVNAKE